MTENRDDQSKKLGEVIKKAWEDEAFKARLLADAKAVLAENGITVPPDLEVKAIENTEKVFHLVLPCRPSGLSEEEMDRIVGDNAHQTTCLVSPLLKNKQPG